MAAARGADTGNYSNNVPTRLPPMKLSVSPSRPGVHPFFARLSARKAAAEAALTVTDPMHPVVANSPPGENQVPSHLENLDGFVEHTSDDSGEEFITDDDSYFGRANSEDQLLSQLHRMRQDLVPCHRAPAMSNEKLETDQLTRRQQMLRLGMSNSAHFRFLQNMERKRRGDGATYEEASLGMRFYSIAARVQKTVHFSSAPQPLDYTLFRKNKSQFMKSRDHDGTLYMEPFRKNLLLNRMGRISHKYAEHSQKHRFLKKDKHISKQENPRCWSQLTQRNRGLLLKIRSKESTLTDTNPLNKTKKLKKLTKTHNTIFSSPYIPSPRKTLPHEDTPFLKYLHKKQEESHTRGRMVPSIPSKTNSAVNPFNPAAAKPELGGQIIEYTQRLLPMPVRAASEPPEILEHKSGQLSSRDSPDIPKEAPTEPTALEENDDSPHNKIFSQEADDEANSFFITQASQSRLEKSKKPTRRDETADLPTAILLSPTGTFGESSPDLSPVFDGEEDHGGNLGCSIETETTPE